MPLTSQSLTGEEGVSVPEELVERVARAIEEPIGAAYNGGGEYIFTDDRLDAIARAALAALPDISSLQGEVERLRKLLDNSSQSQPVLTPSGQPNSEPSAAWRPIATAPSDGTPVLLYMDWSPDTRILMAEFVPQNDLWRFRSHESWGSAIFDAPTHWMPLPEPPVASRAAESSPPSSERASSRDEPETPNPEPSA